MHLDPIALTIRALELADQAPDEARAIIDNSGYGLTSVERRSTYGIMAALCEHLSAMFAEGVGIAAEEGALSAGQLAAFTGIPEDEVTATLRDLEAEGLVQRSDGRTLQDPDASQVAGMSWRELQDYASRQGIDLYDRSGEKPMTKSKATILAELGITKETA